MSDHTITYDLQHPGNGELECHAAPDASCRAVWDCGCETIHGYHVADGVPHHFSTYLGDDVQVRGHHVGHFDPDHCTIRDWHENSDEDVTGTVRVDVDPVWEGDFFTFDAVAAEVEDVSGLLVQKPGRSNSSQDTSGSARRGIHDPRNHDLGEGLAEAFTSLVRQLEGSRSDSARRLEAEITEREKVNLIAFNDVDAALEKIANVIDPLFDIPGLSIEDLKALLNGTVQGRFLLWRQRRREGR